MHQVIELEFDDSRFEHYLLLGIVVKHVQWAVFAEYSIRVVRYDADETKYPECGRYTYMLLALKALVDATLSSQNLVIPE